MSTCTTDVAKTPHCPPLPAGPSSLAIAIPSATDLVVHGTFWLARRDLDAVGANPHGGLVIVVTCGRLHCAATPFRERILFEDDVERSSAGVRGHFTVDLPALVGERVHGTWFVLASLGAHVSPVTVVEVGRRRRP